MLAPNHHKRHNSIVIHTNQTPSSDYRCKIKLLKKSTTGAIYIRQKLDILKQPESRYYIKKFVSSISLILLFVSDITKKHHPFTTCCDDSDRANTGYTFSFYYFICFTGIQFEKHIIQSIVNLYLRKKKLFLKIEKPFYMIPKPNPSASSLRLILS